MARNNTPVDVDGDVRAFHEKFAHHIRRCSGLPEASVMRFRQDRIKEECRELMEAIEEGDLPHIAREAIDLIYVTLGLLIICGIPFYAVWRAVQRANMNKTYNPPKDGVLQKPTKPADWRAPDKDIWDVLNANKFGAVFGTSPGSASEVTTLPPRPAGRVPTHDTKKQLANKPFHHGSD